MDRIESFEKWASEGWRSVKIEIEINKPTYIWAYDYKLGVGQYVDAVEEIDLIAAKEKQERREYEVP